MNTLVTKGELIDGSFAFYQVEVEFKNKK